MMVVYNIDGSKYHFSDQQQSNKLDQMNQYDKYSFRQLLVPINFVDNSPSGAYNKILNPRIVSALGDESQPSAFMTLSQKIVNFYKSFNVVIRPGNKYLLVWQFFLICIILFYILELGMLLAFGQIFWKDQLYNYVATHVIFIFILTADILISPLKSYYEEGLLIQDVSLILKKYMALQFWIDLLALTAIIVPISCGLLQSNWIKLLWLGKIYTASKINKQFQRVTQLHITLNTIYLVLKLIFFCFIYAHYMGLFFYMVSMWVYTHNYYGPNTPNLCWVYNSWAFYQMALLLTWQQMYIYIMYYSIAVVTTIAYGDITPKNPIQCLYTIGALISVTLVFGYLMTEILRVLIDVFSYNFDRGFQHFELVSKLKNQNVKQHIQIQIRAHTNQIDREQQFRNRQIEQKIMNFLPPDPLYGLLGIIYQAFLEELGFNFVSLSASKMQLNQKKSIFLQHFMKEIKQERHYKGDLLYKVKESHNYSNGHNAYYFTKTNYSNAVILGVGASPLLKAGKLDIVQNQKISSFQLCKAKTIFGQVQFLNGQQRSHWAFCVANCVLFAVNRNSLLHNYHLLNLQEKQIVFSTIQKVSQSMCLVCQQNHEFLKCPYSFINIKEQLQMDRYVFRRNRIFKETRTRIKTQSSWTIFKKIKDIRIGVTRQYREKLLLNKTDHSLFIQLELEQDNKDHEDQQFESKLYQAQIMVQKLYDEILRQMGKVSLGLQYDSVYNFKHYKPYNNINEVIRHMKKEPRHAILKREIINNVI